MQGIVTFQYRQDLKEFFNSLSIAILQEYYSITNIAFYIGDGEIKGFEHKEEIWQLN